MAIVKNRTAPAPALAQRAALRVPPVYRPAPGGPLQAKAAGLAGLIAPAGQGNMTIQRSAPAWNSPEAKQQRAADKAAKKAGERVKVAEADKNERKAKFAKFGAHMAGEVSGGKLTGGHLLSAMMAKFPQLQVSALPASQDVVWGAYWHDGTHAPKWSTFFPRSWNEANFEDKCIGNTVKIRQAGATIYPSDLPEPSGGPPALTAFFRPT